MSAAPRTSHRPRHGGLPALSLVEDNTPPATQWMPKVVLRAGAPLPRPLSPRRPLLPLRIARLSGRATRWLVAGPIEQRLFVLLIVAALGALLGGLTVLEHFHPSDFLGISR